MQQALISRLLKVKEVESQIGLVDNLVRSANAQVVVFFSFLLRGEWRLSVCQGRFSDPRPCISPRMSIFHSWIHNFCVCLCVYVLSCICLCECMCACVRVYVCICVRIFLYQFLFVCVCVCVFICVVVCHVPVCVFLFVLSCVMYRCVSSCVCILLVISVCLCVSLSMSVCLTIAFFLCTFFSCVSCRFCYTCFCFLDGSVFS